MVKPARFLQILTGYPIKHLEELLKDEANHQHVNHEFTFGKPIDYSIRSGKLDVVKLLVQFGAQVLPHHLRSAAEIGDIQLATYLREHGAEIDLVNQPPIAMAVFTAQEQMVRWLIYQGADVNKANSEALFNAVRTRQPHIVRLLLENGGNPNATHVDHRTLLHCAMVTHPNIKVATCLLDYGAEPMMVSSKGYSILASWMYYYKKPTSEVYAFLEKLLEKGADINQTCQCAECVINIRCTGSDTMLHNVEDVQFAQWLFAHGANTLNLTDYRERTPLFNAVFIGSPQLVQLFLENGADKSVVDAEGKTALDYAKEEGNEVIIQLLS